jgi:hypothetical protein
MQGTEFKEQVTGDIANPTFDRSVKVLCRSQEAGRSRIPNGTMTDTAQRSRAQLLGLASDSGCSFVASKSARTYVIGR